MTTARAIVLGILQGLGEFLPISSSGHLIVVPWLMGWPDSGLAFDVALHLGTLAAVAFAFWRDWVRLIGAGLRGIAAGKPFADPDARLLWYVALATIPGAVVGKLLDEWAETVFRSPALVSLTMALMGLVLWLADRRASRSTRRDRVAAGRAADRPGPGLRDHPRHLAVRGHDQHGALPRAAARERGPLQLPPGAADHGRGRPRQGARAPALRRGPRPRSRRDAGGGPLGLRWRSASCSPTCGRGTTSPSSTTASPSRCSSGACSWSVARTWDRVVP